MLELLNLSHTVQRRGAESLGILDNVSFAAPGGHLLAVLGACLSGKSTLLKAIAGVAPVQSGSVLWAGRDLARKPLTTNEVAYVADAAGSLHELLSVRENVISAVLLRVAGIATRNAVVHADKLLALCGIDTIASQRASTLIEPQRRRLALACAMAADPLLVVCDGFTEGVDPKAERELGALLQAIAKENPKRVVLNATATLAGLSVYDSVVVLHEGRVCFHGPGRALTHYFSIPHTDDIYHRLAKRPSQRWQESWNRHRDSYYEAFKLSINGSSTSTGETSAELLESAEDDDDEAAPQSSSSRVRVGGSEGKPDREAESVPPPLERPSFGKQVSVLMMRRWTLFRRNKSEWVTHASMLLGLPLLVLLCLWPHRPTLQALSVATPAADALLPGGYTVAMLLLLQVAAMIFMAVRNGAREIAAERSIWVAEHQGGLRSSAYLTAKSLFLGTLVIGQAFWLWLFTDFFAYDALAQHGLLRLVLLILTGTGFTSLCLGISALAQNQGEAASRGWQLAFVQLPLCGALLGLPASFATLVHPFVTAFYGWSGQIDAMKSSASFPAIGQLTGTWFATPGVAVAMLLAHLLVGLGLASWGLRRMK